MAINRKEAILGLGSENKSLGLSIARMHGVRLTTQTSPENSLHTLRTMYGSFNTEPLAVVDSIFSRSNRLVTEVAYPLLWEDKTYVLETQTTLSQAINVAIGQRRLDLAKEGVDILTALTELSGVPRYLAQALFDLGTAQMNSVLIQEDTSR